MTINTILFDLDGTLVNTNELIIASFQHTLDQYMPGKYNRESIIEFIGPPLTDSFHRVDPEKAEEMIGVYQKHNKANHNDLIEEYEGVRQTVAELSKQGYKLAIVTTKRRETALMGAESAGLLEYFPVVVTFDDVTRVKPDPEPLHLAMEQLGAEPEETLMIGDSHYDILGGKNAGVLTAGVAWSIKGEDVLLSYEPDWMLQKMPDLLNHLGVQVT
ncbi:pyrophosphatase PpaX [Alteribacillus sp. HJP-4]|uniref:pyrophosphatase PpaX n=1 Tax=Alteribacillus sp. HJP-4 TaxID=2775394 RepID=UPI0035CCEDFE